jgi:hypothetical protein
MRWTALQIERVPKVPQWIKSANETVQTAKDNKHANTKQATQIAQSDTQLIADVTPDEER